MADQSAATCCHDLEPRPTTPPAVTERTHHTRTDQPQRRTINTPRHPRALLAVLLALAVLAVIGRAIYAAATWAAAHLAVLAVMGSACFC